MIRHHAFGSPERVEQSSALAWPRHAWESTWFEFMVPPGSLIRHVDLYFATQLDTVREPACDFVVISLAPQGDAYRGALPIGTVPPCGPPATPGNLLYYASVQDVADYTVSSTMH